MILFVIINVSSFLLLFVLIRIMDDNDHFEKQVGYMNASMGYHKVKGGYITYNPITDEEKEALREERRELIQTEERFREESPDWTPKRFIASGSVITSVIMYVVLLFKQWWSIMIRRIWKKWEKLTDRYIFKSEYGVDEREASVLVFEVFVLPFLLIIGLFLILAFIMVLV